MPWRSSSLQFVTAPWIFCNAAYAHHYNLNTGSSSSRKIFAMQIFFGNPKKYCCFVITPIHRKMRYLKVHGNLKRRAECFIVKRLPALRIPRDKQTQMSVFALTVQGVFPYALRERLRQKQGKARRACPVARSRALTQIVPWYSRFKSG